MTGRKYAVLAGRASSALWAILKSLGIMGKWVLMPANICYIVPWVVLQTGNFPYLVDVDPLTGNISPKTLDLVPVESPAALIVCHMYGLGAPIAAISQWGKQRGLLVIEDATLALGAIVDDNPAGSWGDISLFSFGEGKIVDIGVGGAFLCNDSELAHITQMTLNESPFWSEHIDQLWRQWSEIYWLLHQYEKKTAELATIYPTLFRIFGEVTCYQIPISRWSRLSKALWLIETNLNHRAEITSLYDEHFQPLKVRSLQRPKGHVMWRYPLLVPPEERDPLLEVLWENGVLASRWYPSLNTMLFSLAPSLGEQSVPGADHLGAEIINLPVDRSVDMESAKKIIEIIQGFKWQAQTR